MTNEFIEKASCSLEEAAKTMHERGSQYSDTWGKDGCWHLTRSLIKQFTEKDLEEKQIKSIALAVFIDQKYSRFAGGYKEDTAIDLIPYICALVSFLKETK